MVILRVVLNMLEPHTLADSSMPGSIALNEPRMKRYI